MPKRIQADFKRRAVEDAAAGENGAAAEKVEDVSVADDEEAMNGPGVAEELRPGTVLDSEGKPWEVRIGFERKGRPGVMDIEVSLSY